MYLYPGQDHTDKDILTVPNYIKHNRKKSNVFIHDGLVCISNGDGTFNTIESDGFKLKSIEVLGPDTFKITDKEGNDYTSNTEGLIKYSIEEQLKDVTEVILENLDFNAKGYVIILFFYINI